MSKNKTKILTKADLKYIVQNYETQTNKEIGEHIKIGDATYICHIASLMRKMGVKIPRKANKGYLIKLIAEVKEELRDYLK